MPSAYQGRQVWMERTLTIKVAAEIVVRARRIVVRLAGSWPYLDHYRQVAEAVLALRSAATADSG